MNILITGATGFLGKAVLDNIALQNSVSLLVRNAHPELSCTQHVANIDLTSSFGEALANKDTVIHCAARVHVMRDDSDDPLLAFKDVNTDGTINLAKQAATAGVKRFIFISTVKVNGEVTLNTPFSYASAHRAKDPYGISKSLAEQALLDISNETAMEVVIIRPPLVYGPSAKGNFAALMGLVDRSIPLPFGLANSNKRSLVYIMNLVGLIVNCIDNPKAANQIFMVSDDNDLSTRELINHMAKALDKKTIQLPVPMWCYRLLGKLTGKSDVVDRLIGSLQVDIQHTKDTLNWIPPHTVEQGMSATAKAFLEAKNK